jgi:nitrite reductase (NO-forming)
VVEVHTVDIKFEPDHFEIPADTDVEIKVTNKGNLQHDFVVEDTDYKTKLLNAGESETITVNLKAGDYVYYCNVPGHREAGMEGKLTVK